MSEEVKDNESDLILVNSDHLIAFIERIERLEQEKVTISQDVKDVYGEAKANGFDTKILKQVVRLRQMDRDARMEEQAILELYLTAIGMK